MILPNGTWVPNLAPKQFEIFSNYKKYTLVSGSRWSAKTRGCLHRIVRHAWEVPCGRVLLMAPTVKNALKGGIWSQLHDTILPEWFGSGIGIRYTPNGTPRVDNTRMNHCSLHNAHGGVTQIQLGSLDYDKDILKILRGKEYSMIFFSELDNFKDRIVFDTSIQQLRMDGVPDNQFMWLADTNPAEEGEESWIWKLFYAERVEEKHAFPMFQKHIHLIESTINDNPFLSTEHKQQIKGSFAYDKDLLDRYWLGLWKASTRNSHFHDVFQSAIHIKGKADSKDESEWEVIQPQPDCVELITGFDLGGGRNHSAHIIEPIPMGNCYGYAVIDEQVAVGKMVRVEDFADEFVQRMEKWEKFIQREYGRKVRWRHWSDNSAFVFRAAGDRAQAFDHLIVLKASNNKIKLMAAPKFPGSVRKRVELVRRLFFENRLWISANCKHTIDMIRLLRKGNSQSEFIADSPHRHPFDSMSYALMSECVEDITLHTEPVAEKAGGSFVMTPA